MQDIFTLLSGLRRPRLLVSAARHGVADYDRDRHLKRLFGGFTTLTPGAAALRLLELERSLNKSRTEGDAAYDVTRHVDVLIALMGEARLLRTRV